MARRGWSAQMSRAALEGPRVSPTVAVASASPQRPGRQRLVALARFAPVLVLAAFVVTSQMRDGVGAVDILRYTLYWVLAVILPGLVISRSLIGVRATVVEDLAVGAVTGISLEILAWVVGVTTGLGSIVRFWWILVLVAGAAVPALRRRVLVRIPERVPLPHSVALAALVGFILAFFDANSLVFQAPLPPNGGNTYLDMWWQLSLVQEMMKYQPPQIPQLAGVPFHYHYFGTIQMASGVRLSGVAPEVVTFRLWYVPAVLLSVGMSVALGRALTRSLTAGVVTAGVVYGLVNTSYIWPDGLGGMALSPLHTTSPSQMLANIGLTACAYGAVLLLRGRASRLTVVWVVLVVLGASGDKSTMVPLLLAGTVITLARAVFTRSWVMARWLAIGTGALLALQAVIAVVAAGTSGGKVTLLGPLRSSSVYSALVPNHELLAMNHGLLLDSITSVRTAVYALLATVVVLGFHTIGLAGVAGLLRRSIRTDYVNWWLAGAVVAGYAAMMSIDHVGAGEVFFGMAGGVLGGALTVSVLWAALARLGTERRAVVLRGLLVGCFVTLLVEYVVAQRKLHGGYGALDRIIIPMVVVALVVVVGWLAWRRVRRRWTRDAAWALALAAIIGVVVPTTAATVVTTVTQWPKPAVAQLPSLVTPAEQKAMLWLRSHSGTDDVVATNAHCVAVVTTKNCPARGFWVSGLSGRRVVLEGWAYTNEAYPLQGVGGRTYDKQPAPFPERSQLNQAVFQHSDRSALQTLKTRFHVRWLVSVHRAGPTPSFPDSVAPVRFDNGAVTIFEVI